LSLVHLWTFLGAALAAWMSLPFWRRVCRRCGLVDEPGPRKIHTGVVPLAGGLTLAGAWLVTLGLLALAARGGWGLPPAVAEVWRQALAAQGAPVAAIAGGAVGMLLLGLADDRQELAPGLKFLGQCVIASAVAWSGVKATVFIPSAAATFVLTVLWIVAVSNAFNFQDNMNGLCAGLAVIAAGFFGLVAARHGQGAVAALAFAVAGGAAGFLPWNFPRARAFLGDSGSHLLGFLLAVLAILPQYYSADHPRRAAVLAPLLILGVPLADLAWVVLYRWGHGRPFYVGDTNHFSHRLERAGLSRPAAVVVLWGAGLALGAVALAAL